MPLGLQLFPLGLDPAGVFGVELPARFQRPPVGGLVRLPLEARPGGDRDKHPGGNRLGEVSARLPGEKGADSPTVVTIPRGTRRIARS